jgi:hypothetical protein
MALIEPKLKKVMSMEHSFVNSLPPTAVEGAARESGSPTCRIAA